MCRGLTYEHDSSREKNNRAGPFCHLTSSYVACKPFRSRLTSVYPYLCSVVIVYDIPPTAHILQWHAYNAVARHAVDVANCMRHRRSIFSPGKGDSSSGQFRVAQPYRGECGGLRFRWSPQDCGTRFSFMSATRKIARRPR